MISRPWRKWDAHHFLATFHFVRSLLAARAFSCEAIFFRSEKSTSVFRLTNDSTSDEKTFFISFFLHLFNQMQVESRYFFFYFSRDSAGLRKVGVRRSDVDGAVLDEIEGGDVELCAVVGHGALAAAPGQEARGVDGQVELGEGAHEHGADALHLAVPRVHVGQTATGLKTQERRPLSPALFIVLKRTRMRDYIICLPYFRN